MTLDNHWMKTHADSPPFDKMRTQHAVTDSYFGYNPGSKLWVTFTADNLGNIGYATTPGWNGNTLTSLGYELKNGKWVATSRTVTTKVSDTEITNVSYDLAADGTAKKSFNDDCKKTSS